VKRNRKTSAFTLTEILIVIGVIVLLLALAVPALRVMTGGRSIEGAENQLSAFLGRARGQAITFQEIRGVMFYKDMTGKTFMTMVQQADANRPDVDVMIDLVPDSDVFALPSGVDVHTMDDAVVSGGSRTDEGFVGYNTRLANETVTLPATVLRYGGAILFEADGQLARVTYSFPSGGTIMQLLYDTPSPPAGDGLTLSDTGLPSPRQRSQLGLVLFDREAYLGANPPASGIAGVGSPDDDDMIDGGSSLTNEEKAEEEWIDKNATPLLINRYNGSLIRGE